MCECYSLKILCKWIERFANKKYFFLNNIDRICLRQRLPFITSRQNQCLALMHESDRTRRNLQAVQMAHCCFVFCSHDWRYKERYLQETRKLIHFHKFPADSDERNKWIIAIRRDE